MVYAGLQNVTGRTNPAGGSWNQLTNQPSVNVGQGRFVLVGMEFSS